MDRLADSNATITHNLVVGQIQHQEVSLVLETLSKLLSSVLHNHAVSKMQVSERFVLSDSKTECSGSFDTDDIVVEHKLCQELFVLETVRKSWNASFADVHVLQGNHSESIVIHQALGNRHDSFVSQRIVVEVYLAEFVFVRKNLSNLLGSFLSDLVVLEVQRKKSIVLFKRLCQCKASSVFDVVILHADLLQRVHHLHAFSYGLCTFFSNVVRVTIQLGQSIVGG